MPLGNPRFFDLYPRFYSTGIASPEANRLEQRYQACIQLHSAIISGRTLLDIGSHDGRWALAALKNGATHVTCIEGRQTLIDEAVKNFKAYGVEPGAYEMHQGDVNDVLSRLHLKVDTVLCLGFLYHTFNHAVLFDLLERTKARDIIIDTEIVQRPEANPPRSWSQPFEKAALDTSDPSRQICRSPCDLQLIREEVADGRMAVGNTLSRRGWTVVARPSVESLVFLFDHFGFDVREVDWQPYIESNAEYIHDYKEGWRSTFVATRRQA